MIRFPPLAEIAMYGPWDRGVPNQERIALVPQVHLNLGNYGLLLGFQNGSIGVPLRDHFFWFEELLVDAGTWVFIYTGPGSTRYTTLTGIQTPAVVLHWGKKATVFHTADAVPILFKFGGVQVGLIQRLALPNQQT